MSCYFHQFKDILDEAGIVITPENKKAVDKTIHEIVGVHYKDCTPTRRKIKEIASGSDRDDFIIKLRHAAANITPEL